MGFLGLSVSCVLAGADLGAVAWRRLGGGAGRKSWSIWGLAMAWNKVVLWPAGKVGIP